MHRTPMDLLQKRTETSLKRLITPGTTKPSYALKSSICEPAIATLYIQLEDYELALLHALNSTGSAPPEEQERLRNLVEQLQQLLKK